MSSLSTETIEIYNKALELSNQKKYEEALNSYRKAISLNPKFIEAYNNIGEIHSLMGNRELAIMSYNSALKYERNFKVLLNLGVEHYNTKDYKKALKLFEESTSKKSDFIEGHFYSAMVYYNLKNFKKSEKSFKAVIKLDPKHLKANYLLSYIYYEWKKYDKAIFHLDNIRDISDDKAFFNKYYGFCCYYLGRYKDAVEYLNTALKSQPKYDKYKSFLNSLTYEKKLKEFDDIDKTIKELEEKMLNKKPDFKEVTKLSMLYIFKGRNNEAEALLLKAKKKLAS